jgi:hypothetical protein
MIGCRKGYSLLSYFKSIFRPVAVAVLVALAGCASEQPSQALVDKNGIRHIPARWPDSARDEFKFSDGTLIMHGNPQAPSRVEVDYNDGTVLTIWASAEFEYGIDHDSLRAFELACKNAQNCPQIKYQERHYGIGPMDGRNWMDSELWMLADFNAAKDAIKYQACRDDHFYSAPDSKTLMDVVDKVESDPAAAKSDPEVEKLLATDDAPIRRLPICNWRHRVGLEVAYPPPSNEGKVRVVPASHSRREYVEAKADKGVVLDVYLDKDQRRLDRIVFKSPKASFSYRPVYNESDCPTTLDRCKHAVTGPTKQPDRFDLRSLDDEPLSQSRIFEVNDTVNRIKYFDGCAGGRLYTGKNRDEVESEVKIALENPAPPPLKGAPMLGAPETSESGDIVIPDAFCDWTYRREQAQALMKKSQNAQ